MFRVGVREQGGDKVGDVLHFFPSLVQREVEGVMRDLEKNRIADL